MPLQQLLAGVGTSAGPSWTVHDGKQVWLAWKGESDTHIYVASSSGLRPDATSGQYSFSRQQKVLTLGTSASPTIASLRGTLYLFYKGAADDYIYWATSADGKTWVDQGLLALGDSLYPGANDQHPQTSAAPTVVSANGYLYLFWKGASDNIIWWSASAGGDPWMEQISISTPGGTPETDASPAVALDGQTIHLAWKGQDGNTIWWSTYSTPLDSGEGGGQLVTAGPWTAQKEIFSATAGVPALVCDGNGVVWLAWTGAAGAVSFASLSVGNLWSPAANRYGIASSDRPTLVSTGNDAQDIVMAWKGESSSHIYYGTLTGPLPYTSGARALLVIAPAAFIADVAPLITHKSRTGIPAIAASIEGIASFFPGADEPEQIKQAIRYAKENLSTQYVMLVGDAAHFPVRFWFSFFGSTPLYTNGDVIDCVPLGSFVQSDLYYANLYHHNPGWPVPVDVFDTWDANGNGLFNEACMDNNIIYPANTGSGLNTACNPDNVDGYPDIAVGRVPARSTSDVQNYVAKVITYETRAAPKNVTFTFVADEPYGDPGATTSMAGLLSGRNVSIDYLLIENSGAAVKPFSNATPEQVGTQAGASTWVSYLGHGGPTVWGEGGVFTSDDVALTKAATGLPVVFACGCGTALFMTNVPWNSGLWGEVTSIDTDGVTRGPFEVNPSATPGAPGLVITDTATNRKWGVNTPGCDPFPVPTPKPAALNVPNACCANAWLFDNCPGGAIVYIGDHCVSNDSFPAEIETNLLNAYIAAAGAAILGDLYLTAQRQYWSGHSNDATTSGLGDYHGIPRLYLGWMVFFGDPSLRIPLIPA